MSKYAAEQVRACILTYKSGDLNFCRAGIVDLLTEYASILDAEGGAVGEAVNFVERLRAALSNYKAKAIGAEWLAREVAAVMMDMEALAAQPRAVPEGWRATRDDDMRMWTVHSPSGDSVGVLDQAAGVATEVLRQLAQDLAAAPSPGESA